MSDTLIILPDKIKISRDHFVAYEKVRKSGKFNMMADSRAAAVSAGLTRTEYMNVIMNYNQCLDVWPEVRNESNTPD